MFETKEIGKHNKNHVLSSRKHAYSDRSANTRQQGNLPHPYHFLPRNLGNSLMQSIVQDPKLSEGRKDKGNLSNAGGAFSHTGSSLCCPAKDGAQAKMQPKLTIGPADDVYEQEADRVAEQVMRMPDYGVRSEYNYAGTEINNRRGSDNGSGRHTGPEIRLNQSGGRPLSASTLRFMEPRFGVSFDHVRLHEDKTAHQAASQIYAKAFTCGNHIYLGRDVSENDKFLMTHELTHTVQQEELTPPGTYNRESARAMRSLPQISHTRSHIIQREVNADLVDSSTEALSRIASRITTADGHADLIVRFINNARETPLGATEPIVRQAITNLVRLLELAFEFNPGAGRDSPRNLFVYTCMCGWIDMGHFFFSALAAYLAGFVLRFTSLFRGLTVTPSQVSLALGFLVEDIQEAVRSFVSGLPPLLQSLVPEDIRAIMRSAYTIEDLPSDAFGAEFGQRVWEGTAISSTTGLITGLLSAAPFDIHGGMTRFFSSCHSVVATGSSLAAMMDETTPGGDPRRHHSTAPYLLTSASPLCTP